MPEVDVAINGRNYQIACGDGEEAHLAQLGEYDHFIVFGPLAKTATSEDGDML